jgi:hypothetical protein
MQTTLNLAEVGGVYNFEYKQPYSGETRRHLAKVVGIRKLTENDITRINFGSLYRSGDPSFIRTETIVTCQMPNGDYRNFYGERTERCRKSLFADLLFWTGLARLIFRG